MADTGYRSIEAQCTNSTRADMTITAVQFGTTAVSWISGEEAKVGDILKMWDGVLWGVKTDDPQSNADVTISLFGLGSHPLTMHISNGYTGKSAITITGNDVITGSVTQITTPNAYHTQFQVVFHMVSSRLPDHAVYVGEVRGHTSKQGGHTSKQA